MSPLFAGGQHRHGLPLEGAGVLNASDVDGQRLLVEQQGAWLSSRTISADRAGPRVRRMGARRVLRAR